MCGADCKPDDTQGAVVCYSETTEGYARCIALCPPAISPTSVTFQVACELAAGDRLHFPESGLFDHAINDNVFLLFSKRYVNINANRIRITCNGVDIVGPVIANVLCLEKKSAL